MEPQHKHNSSTPNHFILLVIHVFFFESSFVTVCDISISIFGLLAHILLILSLIAIVGGGLPEGL